MDVKTYGTALIGKGIVLNKALELSFEIEKEQKENESSVSLDKFGELIDALRMSTKINNEKLFIPSLINTPIINFSKGRSPQEIYNDFKDQLRYLIMFGDGKSFASSGLIEALLVDFYTKLGWNLPHLKGANCYRERIERRIPGIVFAIEIFLPDDQNRKITILEEEQMNFEGGSKNFYTKRVISVFIHPGPKTKEIIEQIHTSIVSAMKKVMKVDFDGKHGLKCFQCQRNGDEGLFNQEECSRTCSKNEEHVINDFVTACDGSSEEDKKFVIKRRAYAVSQHHCEYFTNLKTILRRWLIC